MLVLLAVPWIYFAICAGMSSALPPVDYKAISHVQSPQVNPDSKSVNQVQDPAQAPQGKRPDNGPNANQENKA